MTRLTLEQKAALVVGNGYWTTASAPGIPPIVMGDGPHGLRTQRETADNLGIGASLPATCYPPAVGLGSSWNRSLTERVARAIADEAIEQGVDLVLGPGVNIKRSPLCGRNFEYFSEDPYVSGQLGAAWVRGAQSLGVGASVKHFAANNQETARMTVSAEVDDRTLREIYLPAFEHIVRTEKPATVMCSYNRVNGVAAAENYWLLTELLREEWGFDGLVLSDWGAVDNAVPALEAGLDLEMPGPQRDSRDAILAAVRSGELDESVLDRAVARLSSLVEHVHSRGHRGDHLSLAERQRLARDAAIESIVLLRNERGLLPLRPGTRVAVIGEFARTPRFQGAGSSQVNPTNVEAALPAMEQLADVTFSPGYYLDERDNTSLIEDAVRSARDADVAVLFIGLPPMEESEGFDRDHLDLPADQLALIAAVAAATANTVVVLSNGGVVTVEPWHDSVASIVEGWLLGQAGGPAVADVLFGVAAPSGRLAESIPFRLQDNPSYLNFPGENDVVRYGEGVFVGYRYYESAEVAVRYPFGFGLGYTDFEFSDLVATRSSASVRVTNTGDRAGSHVVQLYVAPAPSHVSRPRRELKGFEKVTLGPGESAVVDFVLDSRSFAYWDTLTGGWLVPGGQYSVEIGHNARDIALRADVRLPAPPPRRLSLDSRVSELIEHPVTGPVLSFAMRRAENANELGGNLFDMVATVPVRRLLRFPGVGEQMRQLPLLLSLANNPVIRAVASWFGKRRRP
ncbi:beta-glucosidase [Microbacteriaceae bacterium SG_E_30_P1]|uniref:Beta-glucosidase n=1 Tax=Antiquaquibacter oligotrophicus TaxID=2880260 RepID=A0ABT6KQL6_9MICO|nr:glycoside hydrolase family 3 C-terminal domain-containing protein [Antiquaquibacter oligotrophicus]MDH6182266.1 beta-glucosidase [Antiquaquibacter oligotrophicus]UDF12077.1 glycoside hydrolase family 3 C-terminal domain-containing protein [Antiquaquibacter oligotrophicus]